MKQRNILVTIGEEDSVTATPIVKIWDLDKQDKSKGAPTCIRIIKLEYNKKPFPVSTFAVLENMTQIAIGLTNGMVIWIKGDLLRDRYNKQKIIHENEEPITGREERNTILFIVTTNKVMTYNTSGRYPVTIIDGEQGCGLGCAIMSDTTHDMVIARDEAIYFYTPDGRGACFVYEGTKTSVIWFKYYLIIVSPPVSQPTRLTASTRSALSLGINNNTTPKSTPPAYELTKVTIFDTVNKFIAYVGNFSQGVRTITYEWGAIYILGMDGKLYRLEEKDTPTKLEFLFKKNLYQLAINLAHSQKYDDTSISEIFKKYGDHLYNSKADYDAAMAQYIRTIGQLEPSYVIRKFLDAQRIHNLVNYLQELHSHGLANADHTTLLINCYTKLKDVARLDQFIKTDSDELKFDLETAIKVCRQAGYYEHAVYLAKKHREHDLYLKIQIEDVHDYENALEYIRQLGPFEADRNLIKYGKVLLNHLAQPTTTLLIDLCTGNLFMPSQPPNDTETLPPAVTVTPYSQGLPFLPFSTAAEAPIPQVVSPPPSSKEKAVPAYKPPSVRVFMSLFVDQPNYLIQFLEQVSEKRWGGFGVSRKPIESKSSGSQKEVDTGSRVSKDGQENNTIEVEEKKAVWNTLLELYLSEAYLPPVVNMKDTKGRKNGAPGSFSVGTVTERVKERLVRKDKALKLLKEEEIEYDTNHALVLCHLAQFDEGIVFLYEKLRMFEDILRFYMAKDNTEKVIQALKKYGPQDQSLYPLTLAYFSSSPTTLASSTSELLQILDYIDSHNLLPPLQVVQALSRNSVATLDMVKGYMGRRIEIERKECEADRKLIASYREETEKRRKEIEELKTSARIFQVTKCTLCNTNLDLPAVHFLCRHSYHQR
ncbi:8204_t:CDS:10 [Ambispora leptoticha]|uniref:E3 ubiquitin-protein ligase PEP5 n=1 Tax=Ambispora leptoticha TaxID=144679 RepID=A0A9N8W789_9GLOM|nr:8204_t:CDS:10 [Ambispora leptoticha]